MSIPIHIETGVLYKQNLATFKGHMHDNFYLVKGTLVKCGTNQTSEKLYLFTTKEVVTAAKRYKCDAGQLPAWKSGLVLGYSYPVSYHNKNGVLTTRYLFHLCNNENIPGLEDLTDVTVNCLFSSREMNRAHERVYIYIKPSIWSCILRKAKAAFKKMTHFGSNG